MHTKMREELQDYFYRRNKFLHQNPLEFTWKKKRVKFEPFGKYGKQKDN